MSKAPVQCRVCGADCRNRRGNRPQKFCSAKCYHASKKGQPLQLPPDKVAKWQRKATRNAAKKISGTKQSQEHRDKRLHKAWVTLAANPMACSNCGESFIRTSPNQLYCSGRCWLATTRKRHGARKPRFTISPREYQRLSAEQGNRCAICQVLSGTNGRNDRLSVDHCHERMVLRGLLCHKCNTALGLFKDNVENLESAIRYLKAHAPP